MSLRIHSEDADRIVGELKKLKAEIGLPLLIFYEILPEKLGIFKRQVGQYNNLVEYTD